MGHKVSPLANRLGFTKTWKTRWFAKRKDFGDWLIQDDKIRTFLKKNLTNAGVASVEIERTLAKIRVIIHSARPGIIIGRRGADIDRLRDDLTKMTQREIQIDIKEIKNPNVEPQLIAENIAFQLERQVAFRRAMKRAIQVSRNSGGLGIRLRCAGRLGGAELSRVESYKDGKVPLGTFRADIEYGFAEAQTTYGRIGVKCWIYRGDTVLSGEAETKTGPAAKPAMAAAAAKAAPPVPPPVSPAKPAEGKS